MKLNEKRSLKTVILTITSAFAIISFWRGVWGLMDLYLFPMNRTFSLLISILIGVVILYLTKNLLTGLR